MARIQGKPNTYFFVYDFAVDGGAVSSINMGVFIPQFSIIKIGAATVATTLVGATATIAVGYAGATGALIAATAVASWTADAVIEGVDLSVAMLKVAAGGVQLQVTIATAALTAGRFTYAVDVWEFGTT